MPARPPVRSSFSKAARKALLTAALLGTTALGIHGLYHALTSDGSPPINASEVKPLQGMGAAAHSFPGRAAKQDELTRNCQIPGMQEPDKQTRDLNELQEYGGDFTRGMLSYAKAAAIYTCYYDSPSYASTYEPGAGVARINDVDSRPDRLAQDIHATVHGYQFIEGQRSNDASWNLYSRVMQNLTAEAVAYSSEFVSAVEMDANGDATLVRFHDKEKTDGWAEFSAAYMKSGDPAAASTAAVNALLRKPSFVAYHADAAIDAYWAEWAQKAIQKDAGIKFTNADAAAMGQLPGGFHLADNAVLPSEQELLKIAPGLTRAFDVFAPANQGSDYAKSLKAPGDFYTARQAIARLDTSLTGQFNYAGRGGISNIYDYCSQADYKYTQAPKATKDLWQNMQTLRGGGQMSSELVSFAERADVFYCYFKLDKDTLGEWHNDDGIVRIASSGNMSDNETLTVEAHETLHGIQRTTHVEDEQPNWNIREYQMMLLSYEGAARISQYLVALELNDKGYDGPYRAMESEFPKPFAAARDAYRDSIDVYKLGHAEALRAAGAAAWAVQFNDEGWTTSYNNIVLKEFISRVMSDDVKAPGGAPYSLETARKTGYVSNDLNFTATIAALPAYNDRFGGNTQMRQAFDYVNLIHLKRTVGDKDPGFQRELDRMSKEDNPYFGIDLGIISGTLASSDTTLTPLEAMNCFAGVSSGCTYGGKPLNADDYKVKARGPGV